MDIEKIKEELSICYLNAIAEVNGIATERTHHDEDSIDVIIKKMVIVESGARFNSSVSIQLKATSSSSQYTLGEEYLTYKLKAKNYNDLCADSAMPSMLAVFILPDKPTDWINWTEEELVLKGQMFWISLQMEQPSQNTSTVSVKIPRKNRLDKDSIDILLKKVAEEGCI